MAAMRSAEEGRAIILGRPSLITRGNGRAYGDAALNARCTLSTLRSNRNLALDPEAGVVSCEAGLLLSDLLEVIVPRGFFPPVTPGTRFVTIGGMVACDVMEESSHSWQLRPPCRKPDAAYGGGLAAMVFPVREYALVRRDLRRHGSDGADRRSHIPVAAHRDGAYPTGDREMRRSRRDDRGMRGVRRLDLFRRLDRLPRPRRPSRARCDDARRTCRAGRVSGQRFVGAAPPYSQCTHRFPQLDFNRWSVSAFNALYYGRAKSGIDFPDYETFFYPLDAVLGWNRIYGAAGFVITNASCRIVPAAGGFARFWNVWRPRGGRHSSRC